MARFFMESGPLIFPVLILAVVIVVLTLYNLVVLFSRERLAAGQRRRSIDAILFWGSVAAMLGFLQQWLGLNRMVRVVAERGIVNPQMVTYGFSESLLTPVTGMFVLVVAAFSWFFLRIGLWSLERRQR
jgi:hypothetical protein